MKRFPIFVFVIACFACSPDEAGNSVSPDLTGIWVNYEVEYSDGIPRAIVPSESVFGVYAESLQIKHNGVYVPVIWAGADDYDIRKADKGKLAQEGNTLTLTEGSWYMEFTILKHDDNELWLESMTDSFMPAPRGTIFRLSLQSLNTAY